MNKKIPSLVILALVGILKLHAANIIWTNGSTDGNWNTAANWSTSNVPGVGDIAIFNGTNTANCIINTIVNVAGIDIQLGYTGTISQSAGFALTVGASHFKQVDGIFIGGNANITCLGDFTLSGGSFTSTTANLELRRDFTSSGGNFNHNNGTVDAYIYTHVSYTGNIDFNNFIIRASNGNLNFTIGAATVIQVDGTFTLSGNQGFSLKTGKILCKGDVLLNNIAKPRIGSAIIEISGASNQNIISTVSLGKSSLPNIVINKSGGTATFSGTVSLSSDWTYLGGNVAYANNATIGFVGVNQVVSGAQNFENVSLLLAWGGGYWEVKNDININGKLAILGGQRTWINGAGIINCKADIDLKNTSSGGGSATINITGTSNQIIKNAGSLGSSNLPNIIIDKTGGTLSFDGIISLVGNWTYLAGNIDYTTNDATIAFVGKNKSINGEQNFHNLWVKLAWGGGAWNINDDIRVLGTLSFSGNQRTDINGVGILNCEGDINLNNTGGGQGNGTIKITGSSNQNIISTVVIDDNTLPNIEINKTGGIASFGGIFSFNGNWTYTAGNVDYTTNDATIAFVGKNKSINGEQNFHNLWIKLAWGGGAWNISDDITILGDFTLSGNQRTDINSAGVINCKGDINLNNTGGGQGNGTIKITGSSNQNIISTVGVDANVLPNIEINKTGGTASFDGIFSFNGNWTYIAGNVDYVTNDATIAFVGKNKSINGAQTFNNLWIKLAWGGGSWNINNDITILGTLSFLGNQRTDINGAGIIKCEGNINLDNTSYSNQGTGTISITGNANQTIRSTVGLGRCELPNVVINKTSDTLSLAGTVSLNRNWTYLSGQLDYASNNATIGFTGSGQHINGVQDFGNIWLEIDWGGGSFNVDDAITINGTLTIAGGQRTDINALGMINCKGDINLDNTNYGNQGTGTINITGSADQTIRSTVSVERCKLANIRIDKTGGTATFDGIISFDKNFTYVDGIVDATTNLTTFASLGSGTTIDGESISGTDFLFYNLSLKTSQVANQQLTGNISIDNILDLGRTRLDMNAHEIMLNNSSATALTAQGEGLIKSEFTDNSSKLNWNIGSNTDNHIFLFGNSSNIKIPFELQLTDGGDLGVVSVSTYPTVSNNTPYPAMPKLVTNLYGKNRIDNSNNVIDRFWQIDKSGPSGTTTIVFSYSDLDISGKVVGKEDQLEAQRYESTDNQWQMALVGQSQDVLANQVKVPNVTEFSPWTLSLKTNPLPIELIDFTAQKRDLIAVLNWQTASEFNNDFFTVERSRNGLDWEEVNRINGADHSSSLLNYATTDEQPYAGISYYRLKQTDFDGQYSYSKIRMLDFVRLTDRQVIIYPNPTANFITIEGAEAKIGIIKIYDSFGQDVTSFTKRMIINETKTMIDLSRLASGNYFVITDNFTTTVYRVRD